MVVTGSSIPNVDGSGFNGTFPANSHPQMFKRAHGDINVSFLADHPERNGTFASSGSDAGNGTRPHRLPGMLKPFPVLPDGRPEANGTQPGPGRDFNGGNAGFKKLPRTGTSGPQGLDRLHGDETVNNGSDDNNHSFDADKIGRQGKGRPSGVAEQATAKGADIDGEPKGVDAAARGNKAVGLPTGPKKGKKAGPTVAGAKGKKAGPTVAGASGPLMSDADGTRNRGEGAMGSAKADPGGAATGPQAQKIYSASAGGDNNGPNSGSGFGPQGVDRVRLQFGAVGVSGPNSKPSSRGTSAQAISGLSAESQALSRKGLPAVGPAGDKGSVPSGPADGLEDKDDGGPGKGAAGTDEGAVKLPPPPVKPAAGQANEATPVKMKPDQAQGSQADTVRQQGLRA